ncbi:hypothetical protein V5O48_005931 [Marasmius crinis-equi]|uniref:GH16 domain-containing protein n=1 Tax=Marasmius crinis-equi TaxID=585013 RepID=A0ABR3FKZ6_9AGAR
MSNRNPRRTQQPPQAHYSAVPTSPKRSRYSHQAQPSQPIPRSPSNGNRAAQRSRGALAQGVATGAVGGMYGPYSHYNPNHNPNQYDAPQNRSGPSSDLSHSSYGHRNTPAPPPKPAPASAPVPIPAATTATVQTPQYVWDKDPEADDIIHNPDPARDRRSDFSFTIFSARGWGNVFVLVVLVAGLLMLFAGFPIINWWQSVHPVKSGFNLGGINASGQIPDLPGLRGLIDKDTPDSVKTRTGGDGKKYNLVFSDEFNENGRTFYPGDDPYWEAADLHYWPTGDLEWYDPSAATTNDGKLVLTMTQEPIHDLNWKSGMITSWNKLCFNTGYIEVSISLPGSSKAPGFWPGAWTLGNLGRAGYGATTEGMWPYSYDTCDLGTFPHQTDRSGNPKEAETGGLGGGPLSLLPGQRLSACTCPGSDHPGPSTSTGRGAPEIDIIEAQIDTDRFVGEVSQSYQIAPYNMNYRIDRSKATIYDTSITKYNTYEGGPLQQAVSAVSDVDDANYGGKGYATYGFEYWTDPNHRDQGFIEWYSQGKKSWKVTAGAIGPDSQSKVNQRLIPEEPMYVILNFGIAEGFQKQDFKHLQFPAQMYIDYVRIYQREGTRDGITCNPPNRPTSDYIEKHIQAYTNANVTTWHDAGFTFPRNSQYDGC